MYTEQNKSLNLSYRVVIVHQALYNNGILIVVVTLTTWGLCQSVPSAHSPHRPGSSDFLDIFWGHHKTILRDDVTNKNTTEKGRSNLFCFDP